MPKQPESPSAIKVTHVTKIFRLPHEKHKGVKQLFLQFYKRGKSRYEEQLALKDVSIDIKQGDFFGIVGRNGSGKSTLLKLLAGIYTPTKGDIHVTGRLTPFIELGVGFNPELTGRENVFLNGALLGFSHKEMKAMYQDIVDFSEIERFMDQKLKNYSSGMQVRLAFSIAIRAQSDILLLDEVLAVGDAAFQQKCYDYFEELKRRKQTVVFVSHDMGAVRRFCNKAVYIEKGKVTHSGTPADIADVYVEDNIEATRESEDREEAKIKPDSPNKVLAKITKQTADKLTLEISYKSKEAHNMYAALSVIKDGISIAEISTPIEKPLKGKGSISYTLDTTLFNPGIYQMAVVLCRTENRQLLAAGAHNTKFVIKGYDITKGAALNLEHTWKY